MYFEPFPVPQKKRFAMADLIVTMDPTFGFNCIMAVAVSRSYLRKYGIENAVNGFVMSCGSLLNAPDLLGEDVEYVDFPSHLMSCEEATKPQTLLNGFGLGNSTTGGVSEWKH